MSKKLTTYCRKALLASGLLAAAAPGAHAFWRLPCAAPVVVERADPIEQPGEVSRHLHTVMGSNAFNFTMDYASTQRASCSTCKAKEDLSSYWVPSLYYRAENGSFVPVDQTGGILVYYLQRTDPKDPEAGSGLLAFPEGFRMIAGSATRRNKTSFAEGQTQSPASFVCLGVDGPHTPEMPPHNCPGGLRAQITFPSCWDGTNVDSPDHKSHVAYPSGMDTGFCPPSHPKRLVQIFYEVVWEVDAFKDMWYGDHQPFVFSNGDPDGYGYHGDFLNGWHVPTLQKAVDECTAESGVIEECGAFTFRTDDEMNSCRVLPRVHEAVTGVLPALPGCNPIQSGPEEAAVHANGATCDARSDADAGIVAAAAAGGPNPATPAMATEIGDPVLPFTDVTKSLGWRFAACALDPQGSTRTLDGASDRRPDMTVDSCVAFCDGGGFRFAGLENSEECYCGNTAVAADRLPAPGLLGRCDLFTCGGNATQFCGGSAEVGVYEKCDGGAGAGCKNMELPDL